ncbi:glycosyltransferase [Parabacteroides gordonii]|uniref:glycosyltransferase n=1 Tax=Parabacteroides gordonii TaxID=574930 RepID=UPI000ED0BE09|nr:glycosyltransferase [Parabacteroides gordonii]RGP16796.1 glycosyltransferase [Parabacteroides gordonii]
MKIIHVISSMSTACGGPAYTTLLTLQGTRALGMDVTVLTNQPAPGEETVSDNPSICYLPRPRFHEKRWGYSKAIPLELNSKENEANVYHIQGLWQYAGYATAKFAWYQGFHYMITLHGTLYPQALAHSSLIKKIALNMYQRRQLQQADCIHVTCREEMEHYRALGFTNPVAVVPNPMEISDIENPFEKKKKRVGYLGRLHPVKGVDRLLKVWKNLHEFGELLIMGDGEPDYVAFLKKEAEHLQLSNISFVGWVSGIEKNRLLASLTCLVVPSDFENFGMIVPEALLQKVPVIASTGSPWDVLKTYRCGWWVSNEVAALGEAVREALSLDEEELQAMGKRGRQLVLDKYSVDVVSRQMEQLYAWVAGQGDKPEFVYD